MAPAASAQTSFSSSSVSTQIDYGRNGNQVVEAGDSFYVPRNGYAVSCTMGPVITPHIAFTAGHCANPGEPIVVDGKVVGKAITPIVGKDAVMIALNGSMPSKMTKTSIFTPRVGEKISMRGSTSGLTSGKVTSGTQIANLDVHGLFNTPFTAAYMTDMPVQKGDSGGAVYNSRGEVVGIISGAVEGKAGIVPVIW